MEVNNVMMEQTEIVLMDVTIVVSLQRTECVEVLMEPVSMMQMETEVNLLLVVATSVVMEQCEVLCIMDEVIPGVGVVLERTDDQVIVVLQENYTVEILLLMDLRHVKLMQHVVESIVMLVLVLD